MNTSIKTAFAALAFVAATAAHAAEPRLIENVSFSDLNLDSPKGAQILMSRLHGAARNVCAPLAGVGVDNHVRYSACYDKAVANAVPAVNKPNVTAKYLETKNGPQG